jgi:hypothetical protein
VLTPISFNRTVHPVTEDCPVTSYVPRPSVLPLIWNAQ